MTQELRGKPLQTPEIIVYLGRCVRCEHTSVFITI